MPISAAIRFQPAPVQVVQTTAQREQRSQLPAVITAQKPGRTSICNLSVLFALILWVGLPIEKKEFLGKLDRPSMTLPVLPPVVRPSVRKRDRG
jgi:hypothetical protein